MEIIENCSLGNSFIDDERDMINVYFFNAEEHQVFFYETIFH